MIRITLAGDRNPPTEAKLFSFGVNDTMKGKFVLTRDGAQQVMMRHSEHGVDLMLDFEHHSLSKEATPEQQKASGWGDLEVRDDGLYLVNIRWTPKAAEYLKNGEFRYLSPAFNVDDENHIIELVNVALTNLPATHDAPALVAASLRSLNVKKKMSEHLSAACEKMGGAAALSKHLGVDEEKLSSFLSGGPMSQEEMKNCSSKLGIGDDEVDEKHALDGVDVNKMEPHAGEGLAGLFEHLSEAVVPHDPDEADENQHGEIKASRKPSKAAMLSKLVKLTGKEDPEALVDYVMSLMGTAEKYKADSETLSSVRKGVDADYRKNLIEANKAKMTPKLVALSRTIPTKQLKEFIDAIEAPVELREPETAHGAKMIALSREEKEVVKLSGNLTEEKFSEFKETLSAAELYNNGQVAGHRALRGDKEPQSSWDVRFAAHVQTLSLTGQTPEGKPWKPAPGSRFIPAGAK
jgi:Mu-like prophage I protein